MVLAGILFALTAGNLASAATVTIQSRGDGQAALVSVDGDLVSGDGDQFRSKTGFLSKAIVSFRSDGGSVVAGIQIGESIRLKAFSTVVAGNARCASACALAWLGGTRRFMDNGSRIGFHAAYDKDGKETGLGNALIGAYLNKIGLPYAAVVYITQAAPNSMTWLSVVDAEKQGIDVELLGSPRVAVAPAIPSTPPSPTTRPNSVSPACIEGMAEMISQYRREHGLSTVRPDPELTVIAERQALAMAVSGILDHSVAGPFASRVAGLHTGEAAENIAAGTKTCAETLRLWQSSPGHNANLLQSKADSIGVGVARNDQNKYKTFWSVVIADRSQKARR